MPIDEHLLMPLTGVAALALLAAALARVLRWAQIPGGAAAGAICAGIVLGLLAGPGVLGKVAPATHAALFEGPSRPAHELAGAQRTRDIELAALTAAGVTKAAVDELRARHEERIKPLRDRLKNARAEHRALLVWSAHALLAILAMLLAPSLAPARASALRRLGPHVSAQTILAGASTLALCAGPPAALAIWLMEASPKQAVAWGLALAAPGLSASMRPSIYLWATAWMLASLVAALLVGWSPAMTLVGAGLMLGALAGVGIASPRWSALMRRVGRRAAIDLLLPGIAAILSVTLDLVPLAQSAPGPFWAATIIGALASSDGRWSSAWMVWRVMGTQRKRQRAWTAAASVVNAGTGVTQVSLLLVFAGAGLATPHMIAGGLLGAAIVEVTRGVRTWLAHAMDARAGERPGRG